MEGEMKDEGPYKEDSWGKMAPGVSKVSAADKTSKNGVRN